MSRLRILTYPDPSLKQVSEPVEHFGEELRRFVQELEEARRAGPAAVGIAAPQVGCLQRIVIVDCSGTRRPVENHGHLVLINPEIGEWEGYVVGREGCLSVPDYTGNVIRAERIHLRANDEHGKLLEFDMHGFEARAVQHEIDHLDGLLFLDRLVSRRNDLFRRKNYQTTAEQGGTNSK